MYLSYILKLLVIIIYYYQTRGFVKNIHCYTHSKGDEFERKIWGHTYFYSLGYLSVAVNVCVYVFVSQYNINQIFASTTLYEFYFYCLISDSCTLCYGNCLCLCVLLCKCLFRVMLIYKEINLINELVFETKC